MISVMQLLLTIYFYIFIHHIVYINQVSLIILTNTKVPYSSLWWLSATCKQPQTLSLPTTDFNRCRAVIFQQCIYVTVDIVFTSAIPSLEAVLQAMFYCQPLVSACCISASWRLFISCHQMSMGQSSMSNSYPAQFDLVYPFQPFIFI